MGNGQSIPGVGVRDGRRFVGGSMVPAFRIGISWQYVRAGNASLRALTAQQAGWGWDAGG